MTGSYNVDNVWEKDTLKQSLSKKTKKKKRHLADRCAYCLVTENLTIDHVIPKSKGGKDHGSNYQTLCEKCNSMKGDMSQTAIRKIIRWVRTIDANRSAAGVRPLA